MIASPAAPTSRTSDLRRARTYALITVSWNVVEGVIAIGAGLVAGSVALLAFGVDSFVETGSALVAGWRVQAELTDGSGTSSESLERRTSRITGGLLLALCAGITLEAGRRLLGFGEEARESGLGLAITAVSLVVMPILGRAKLRVATRLGSRTLRADAFETLACAWLSLTTLAGLTLNALFGWWWADPLAALILVPLVYREGMEAWRGEACGCHGE